MSIAEAVFEKVQTLSPEEQTEVLKFVDALKQKPTAEPKPKPRRTFYGALADLGPAPSAEDIQEVRKEMWANFPDEDI